MLFRMNTTMNKSKQITIIDQVHPALSKHLEAQGYVCIQAEDWEDDRIQHALKHSIGLVMRSRWSLNAAWFSQYRHLAFVARVGAGLEHIDTKSAEALGIRVLSSPEGNRQAVAEHALGMLLSLLHRVRKANDEVRQGVWQRKPNQGEELHGKTIGIIGYGNTGSAFAHLLTGFGVKVLAYDKYRSSWNDPFAQCVGMDEIFEQADAVSLHIPLNAETTELVQLKWLSRFAKSIYLINTSRGQIARDADMLDALNTGKLLGAALDVLSIERENLSIPPWEELPAITKALIKHPNALVTPHIAGLSEQSYQKLSTVMAEKIIAFLQSA